MKKIKSGKLSFVQNIIVNQKKYYQELTEGSHCPWEPNMSKERIEEISRDWREENVFNWRWAKNMRLNYANKNEITHLIFKENQIKFERESLEKESDLQNEFNLLYVDSLCSIRFYENEKGLAKKTVINSGTTHHELWNVDFFSKKRKTYH